MTQRAWSRSVSLTSVRRCIRKFKPVAANTTPFCGCAYFLFIGHGSERTTSYFASSWTDETDCKALPINELAKFSAHPWHRQAIFLVCMKDKKISARRCSPSTPVNSWWWIDPRSDAKNGLNSWKVCQEISTLMTVTWSKLKQLEIIMIKNQTDCEATGLTFQRLSIAIMPGWTLTIWRVPNLS